MYAVFTNHFQSFIDVYVTNAKYLNGDIFAHKLIAVLYDIEESMHNSKIAVVQKPKIDYVL